MQRHRLSLLLLDVYVAVTALIGGLLLVADPRGTHLQLSPQVMVHGPFTTFLVPGLVLSLVVGGSALLAAILLIRGSRAGLALSGIAGMLLGGWILVELVLVRPSHLAQAAYLLIGATQLGLAIHALRHHEDPTADVPAFLAADTIALVGLSTQAQDFSHTMAEALIAHGQRVVGVHPSAAEISGLPAWPHVSAIPEPPAAALLMVPPDQAEAVVFDCIAAGVRTIWFHRGVGAGSASPRAIIAAQAAGIHVITDACPLMFLGPVTGSHRMHRWARGVAA